MAGIDLKTASADEVIAEAARRTARRAAGLTLSEGNPAPQSDIKEAFVNARAPGKTDLWRSKVEGNWLEVGDVVRHVSIPWSMLVPDNERSQPVIRGHKPFMVLTARYKTAKAQARSVLAEQVGEWPALTGRIQIVANLIEPNASRTRDLSNFAKLVHDALSGIVYVDDGQIDDLRWRRAQPDIDRPRLDIAVTEVRP